MSTDLLCVCSVISLDFKNENNFKKTPQNEIIWNVHFYILDNTQKYSSVSYSQIYDRSSIFRKRQDTEKEI
jgi:hypothetical protein